MFRMVTALFTTSFKHVCPVLSKSSNFKLSLSLELPKPAQSCVVFYYLNWPAQSRVLIQYGGARASMQLLHVYSTSMWTQQGYRKVVILSFPYALYAVTA